MIRVSKLADYGTVVMAYMAKTSSQSHNARDIAAHTKIALPTVSKILKLLARKGLLTSQRGPKGGYLLARVPDQISMAEIVSAMDGDFGMTDCSHKSSACSLEPICSVRSNWRLISSAIYHALECVTLADMAKPLKSSKLQIHKEDFLSNKQTSNRI